MSHPVLRPKPDAHRMYAQDQVVIHTIEYKHRKPMSYYIVSYYKNLLQVQKGLNSGMDTILPQVDDRGFRTPIRGLHQSTPHLLSSRA
jgi:hypothetical protein